MAYTSEIEKLERRHKENPEGRYFAPLADNYRKAGEVPRALELLTTGLKLHPGYVSAHIVLGRCHLDLNDLPAAESAFRGVLELDKENVIAIRALAEISERQNRFGEAEEWLNYLLTIDGSNEDARLQLTRVGIIREQFERSVIPEIPAEASPPPEKTQEVEPPARASAAADVAEPTVEIPPAAAEPAPSLEPAPDLPLEEAFPHPSLSSIQSMATAEVDALDEAFDTLDAMPPVPTPEALSEPLELDREESLESGRTPVEGEFMVGVEKHEEIVLRPSATSEYQVPSDADLLSGGRTSGGFMPSFEEDSPAPPRAEMPEPAETGHAPSWLSGDPDQEASTASEDTGTEPDEAQVSPAASGRIEWFQPEPEPEPEPEQEMASASRAPEPAPEPEPVLEAHAGSADSEEPAEEIEEVPAGEAEPEPLVTETMAEVYAAQGHHAEAAEVYRQLLVRAPDDQRLRERISELESRAPVHGGAAFSAASTGGQSVLSYFGDLLSSSLTDSTNGGHGDSGEVAEAEVPAPGPSHPLEEAFEESDPPLGGEPTRPAQEPLSLSAIFGEDSSPIPPAVAGPDSGDTARRPGSSFDEFFGEPPAGGTPGPRARTIRVSESDQDDLDQFHKWLKGLKR